MGGRVSSTNSMLTKVVGISIMGRITKFKGVLINMTYAKKLIATSAAGIGGALLLALPASAMVHTSDIANGAVTAIKVANHSLTDAQLHSGAVTNSKLADGAVTSSKLRNNSVINSKIADGAVTSSKLASDLSLTGTVTLNDGTSTLGSGVATGTLMSSVKVTPAASAAAAGVTRHQLVALGDVTGNTAFGFGDVAAPTYGVMADFGRTAVATSGFTGTDTSLDVRAINKLVNNSAYNMQGAYVKAKNYSGATVGTMKGLYVETDNSGTATTVYGMELSTPGSAINSVIKMTSASAAYGIDMGGGTFSTADIRLGNNVTIASAASNPGSCVKGSLNLNTTDGKAYVCSATNTWTVIGTQS